MTRSIARLRQGHTRQNGMAEIRAMAEGLLEADIPVVLNVFARLQMFTKACFNENV